MDTIRQFAIWDRPDDYPDGFVVREWLVNPGDAQPGGAEYAATLDEARALIPAGAELVATSDPNEPKIVEVWMLRTDGVG